MVAPRAASPATSSTTRRWSFNRSDAVTFAGVISGTGSLTQAGTGTTTLTGANTYTGGTTISAGTLQLGNGGTTGSIAGNIVDNSALVFNRSDALTYAGVISGTGSLTQAGTGTTILTGANTYTGGTTISAGTLQVGNGGTTGSYRGQRRRQRRARVQPQQRADLCRRDQRHRLAHPESAPAPRPSPAPTPTPAARRSAPARCRSAAAAPRARIAGNVVDNGALVFNRSDALTYGGVISGTGSLTKSGAGTLTLTGDNTYTGGYDDQRRDAAGRQWWHHRQYRRQHRRQRVRWSFNRSDAVTYAGVISGTGSLTQAGTGTTTLTGANTYTGGTTISAGTLQLGNGGTTGSIAGNIVDNRRFVINRSDAVTLAGVISGTGSLTQAGTGTTILTGDQHLHRRHDDQCGRRCGRRRCKSRRAAGAFTFAGGTLQYPGQFCLEPDGHAQCRRRHD